MKLKLIPIILSAGVLAGCQTTAGPTMKAKTPQVSPASHFIPMPPQPTTPPVYRETSGQSGATTMSGVTGQVVKIEREGRLAELTVNVGGPQDGSGSVTIELRKVVGDQPSTDRADCLARLTIPADKLPRAGSEMQRTTRLNVQSFGIDVKKDELLAIVLWSNPRSGFQFAFTSGDSYTAGGWFDFKNGQWQPRRGDLQFSLKLQPADSPRATTRPFNPQVLSTQPSPEFVLDADNEDVFGLASPIAARNAPLTMESAPQPAPRNREDGAWQSRVVAFQHEGRWMLEVQIFNGTRGMSYGGGGYPGEGPTITLTRLDDKTSKVAYPPTNPAARANPYGSYGMSLSAQPGTGVVRHFPLHEADEPLKPGRYRATLIYPAVNPLTTAETEFEVK